MKILIWRLTGLQTVRFAAPEVPLLRSSTSNTWKFSFKTIFIITWFCLTVFNRWEHNRNCYLFWTVCASVIHFPLLPHFSGRCASCGENVVGEGTGCTAMDQVFHVSCFICVTCGTKLRGKPFYAVEKKAFCEPCYIVRSSLLSNPTVFSPRPLGALFFLCIHVRTCHWVFMFLFESLTKLEVVLSHYVMLSSFIHFQSICLSSGHLLLGVYCNRPLQRIQWDLLCTIFS